MDWSFSYGGSIITVNQNPCVLIPHVSYTDAMPMNSTKACETIICGSGMRPGDIVTVSNGKTMEVLLQAYKLTKQGESFKEMGWRQVTFDARGGKMLSTMTMETNSITSTNVEVPMASGESLLFKRAITVTALGTLFDAASDCQAYLRQWLPASLVRLAAPLLQPYNEKSFLPILKLIRLFSSIWKPHCPDH